MERWREGSIPPTWDAMVVPVGVLLCSDEGTREGMRREELRRGWGVEELAGDVFVVYWSVPVSWR